jgi:hypothetical protein
VLWIGHSVDASMISRLLYSLRCSDGILHVLLYCSTFHPMAFLVSILSILICRLVNFHFYKTSSFTDSGTLENQKPEYG